MHRLIPGMATLLVAAASTGPAWAATQCARQSPAHRVALIELYTSEGCDSCPAADKWLSGLSGMSGMSGPGGPQSGEKAVTLALHVDYWDRLGWKDRFANPLFTERQGKLSGLGGSKVIYTPGVYLNLREFRNWSSAPRLAEALAATNASPPGADISLQLARNTDQLEISAQFKLRARAGIGQAQAFVALYEHRLSTDVKAGENRGATLRHDSVVRHWIGPIDLNRTQTTTKTLPLDRSWKAADMGVAAFIQDLASGEMLQATAMPLCTI